MKNLPIKTLSTSPLDSSSPARTQWRFQGLLPEWGLLLLCLTLFFWRLGSVPLFDLDEALYVSCSRQMALSGNEVTPRLNSRPLDRPLETTVPFFEKPILVYWLCTASLRLFALSEFAARLPSAFAALLTTGAIVWVGRRRFGRYAGLFAGLVYVTSPLPLLDARQMTTDGLLVLWFTLAMVAFYERLSPILFWLACAGAVLTKGAVGLLLPSLVLGIYLLFARVPGQGVRHLFGLKVRPFRAWWPEIARLRPALGLLLFLALVTPWHYFVWKEGSHDANGRTFVQEYIVRQHIGRFKGGDKVHNAPLPTFVVFFLVSFFPWACFTPAAFRFRSINHGEHGEHGEEKREREKNFEEGETRRFLLVWFWTIFLFFSLGAAKLPTYIAPVYPAAALLLGRWLDKVLLQGMQEGELSLQRGALGATMTGIFLWTIALLAPKYVPAKAPIPTEVVQLVQHLTLVLAVGSGLAWVCFGQRKRRGAIWNRAGVGTLATMMVLLMGIAYTEGYDVATREIIGPYQEMAARANASGDRPIVYYHIVPRRPSMLFYANYSPLERKETPLLPFLQAHLTPSQSEVDVITSRHTLEQELLQELVLAPQVRTQLLAQSRDKAQSWVLVRLILGRR